MNIYLFFPSKSVEMIKINSSLKLPHSKWKVEPSAIECWNFHLNTSTISWQSESWNSILSRTEQEATEGSCESECCPGDVHRLLCNVPICCKYHQHPHVRPPDLLTFMGQRSPSFQPCSWTRFYGAGHVWNKTETQDLKRAEHLLHVNCCL